MDQYLTDSQMRELWEEFQKATQENDPTRFYNFLILNSCAEHEYKTSAHCIRCGMEKRRVIPAKGYEPTKERQ